MELTGFHPVEHFLGLNMKEPVSGDLSEAELLELVRVSPIPAIDIVCTRRDGKILLMRRTQEPARRSYFVPGGRIQKGETIKQAFERILLKETGFAARYEDAKFIRRCFEHHYATNRFGIEGLGTDYVPLGFEVDVSKLGDVKTDPTHDEPIWLEADQIYRREDVHPYAKDYVAARQATDNEYLVGAGIAYEALINHYTHYDSQMWSRTQLIIAVEGATLVGSWTIQNSFLAVVVLALGSMATIAVWWLIEIDRMASRINETTILDSIATRIFQTHGLGKPMLRGNPLVKGRWIVRTVVWILVICNVLLAWLFWFHSGHLEHASFGDLCSWLNRCRRP